MKEWITGRNAVYEILSTRSREIYQFYVSRTAEVKGRMAEILKLAAKRKLAPVYVDRVRLDRIDENHQGLALEVSGFHYSDWQDIEARCAASGRPLFVLFLDLIQNPQNFGSLIRTAAAAGMHGVVIPTARSAGVTPAVTHASVGATEHIPIVQMNLAQGIQLMHDAGGWVVGLEGGPDAPDIELKRLGGKLGIVVGGEGEGLRRLTREACDELARLPMVGEIESLNAAVAGSVVIYLSVMAHRML